jgi:hypothetical protein
MWNQETNIRGPTGPQGATGAASTIPGPQGPQGIQGPQGPQGIQGPGSGDVLGPASAVNNDIAVFDLTTGKLIKDSGVPIASLQPLDGDLTSLAAAAAISAMYYRSAADTWATVTIGSGITFTAGTLAASGGGGNVSNSGTPTSGQLASWINANQIQGITVASLGLAPLASPTFTGTPAAPTASVGTNTTQLATTAYVLANAATVAPLMNGVAAVGTATKSAREDHVHPVDTSRAPLASPGLTGVPTAPTATANTNTTQIATTAYADAADALKAPLASPTFTGDPKAPTPTAGDNDTSIATTAFVTTAAAGRTTPAYVDAADALRVLKAGDTMTGALTLAPVSGNVSFTLNKSASGVGNNFYGNTNSLSRWVVQLGNEVPESSGNAGSDFTVLRYNDAGVFVDTALTITRATGNATVAAALTVGGAISGSAISTGGPISGAAISGTTGNFSGAITATGGFSGGDHRAYRNATDGVVYFGSGGSTTYLYYTAGQFQFNGGPIYAVTGNSSFGALSTTGAITVGGVATFNSGGNILKFSAPGAGFWYDSYNTANRFFVGTDGATDMLRFYSAGSAVSNILQLNATSPYAITLSTNGSVQLAGGYVSRTGLAGVYSTFVHNFNWTGSLFAYVDNTNVGQITLTSDYRIKKDVVALPAMWGTVKNLRPISYTQQDYTPPSELAAAQASGAPFIRGDNIERWGFLAHELQESMVPSAASCLKDDPNALQSPNPWTIIAALTRALQEAMTRIEALEARP